MNPIFRYTTMMIILILTNTRVLVLPAEAMGMPHVDPIVKLAQEDAGRDAGLKWFAYGAGCWMFAVIHASVNNPTVPSDRLLGKSLNTLTPIPMNTNVPSRTDGQSGR